jgi:AcrR family transcriptional regulator
MLSMPTPPVAGVTLGNVARPATRPYHHGNLRAALLERAVEVVDERGARDLSLRELARDVGVSHAAPRRHFADREALLDALAVEGFDRLGADLRAAVENAGPAFGARLEALARTYVGFATEHGALLELMFATKRRDETGDLHTAANRSFETLLQVIADGQAAGELVPGDHERIAVPIFAALQGLTAMVNGGMLDRAQLDEAVTLAIDQLLHGLRPR